MTLFLPWIEVEFGWKRDSLDRTEYVALSKNMKGNWFIYPSFYLGTGFEPLLAKDLESAKEMADGLIIEHGFDLTDDERLLVLK